MAPMALVMPMTTSLPEPGFDGFGGCGNRSGGGQSPSHGGGGQLLSHRLWAWAAGTPATTAPATSKRMSNGLVTSQPPVETTSKR
jgi:hypothetical protein